MNCFLYHRLVSGLTQNAVAKILNITQGAVSQWENGSSLPRTGLLSELAKLYKCSIDDLISEKPSKKPSRSPPEPSEEERRQQELAGWGEFVESG